MPSLRQPLPAVLVVLVASVLLSSSCRAELPSPRFDRLTPLGAAAGSSVDVEIAGADIEVVGSRIADRPALETHLSIRDRAGHCSRMLAMKSLNARSHRATVRAGPVSLT